jgi:hypothetical protein
MPHNTFIWTLYPQNAIQCFLFKSPVSTRLLGSTSSYLRLLPPRPVTCIRLLFWINNVFRRQFLRNMWLVQLAIILFMVCTMYLSPLLLCNTSFPTRLVLNDWSIFPILLQHHISNLSKYFWSMFRSVQFSAPYKAMAQIYQFTGLFLIFNPNIWWKDLTCVCACVCDT